MLLQVSGRNWVSSGGYVFVQAEAILCFREFERRWADSEKLLEVTVVHGFASIGQWGLCCKSFFLDKDHSGGCVAEFQFY